MTPATEESPGSVPSGTCLSRQSPFRTSLGRGFPIYGRSDRALSLANHRFCNSQLSTEPAATSSAPHQNGSDRLRCSSSALAPTDSTGVA